MIKRVLITQVDHFLKVLFLHVPLIWHRYGKHKPLLVKWLKQQLGCYLSTTGLFYFYFTIWAFLQPIQSMTFERLRGCSCSWREKPSPRIIPGLSSLHTKHIWDWNKCSKLNVSLAESPFVKPFPEAPAFSSLQFFFFSWILNQWADDNMNNSSTVLQVWAKELRVNHKSTQRKTNKLLRESNRGGSATHAAPGIHAFPPRRCFMQLDEGCGPIMRYWPKRPSLLRWWRKSLGSGPPEGVEKGLVNASRAH